jgi:archaellum component FlaC
MADEIDDVTTPDEFEMMFEQESVGKASDKGDTSPADPPADDPPADDPPADDPPADDPPAEDEAKKAEDAKKAQEAEAKKAKDAEAAQKAEEARKAREAKAEEERKAAEARRAEEAKKAEHTDDEKKLLEEIEKDFPDIKKALSVQERILEQKFKQQIEALKAEFGKTLEPVVQTTQTVARNAYEAEILGTHPDAFERMDEISKWVDDQPAILKKAYNHILDNPVPASEVVELFDLFKKATADPGADAKAQAEAKAAEEKKRVEAEKQKKLDSQEGVRARRSDPKKNTGPLDFESAFATVA